MAYTHEAFDPASSIIISFEMTRDIEGLTVFRDDDILRTTLGLGELRISLVSMDIAKI